MSFILESLQWDESTRTRLLSQSLGKTRCALSTAFSQRQLCSGFCGGKHCIYCRPYLSPSMRETAIPGLRATWITTNILATSRPSSGSIKRFDIIQHFRKNSIVAVFNLQEAFEHDACGDGVGDSGFSYDPYEFMQQNIYFYNFRWPDYGCGSVEMILDAVAVMQSSLMHGKVAVHCHAGLGRTGALIACYLVYNNRLSAHEAIQYVRYKRPGSIQTLLQVQSCQQFEQFIAPFYVIFDVKSNPFTLTAFLKRQHNLLHGIERKRLRNIPRILYFCYKRLLALATGDLPCSNRRQLMIISQELENSKSTVESGYLRTNPCFESLNNRFLLTGPNGVDELKKSTPEAAKVITAVLTTQYSKHTDSIAERWKTTLNNRPEGWDLLDREEHDAPVISKLLFDWLAHLKSPVIRAQDFHTIDISTTSGVIKAMEPLETAVACVLILSARFMVGLGAKSDIVMMALIKRFVYAFCQIDHKFEPGVQLVASMPCIPRVSPISHDCSNAAVKLMSILIDFIRAKQYLS